MSNYSHAEIFGSTLARGSSLFLGAAPDPFLEVGVVAVTLRVVAAFPYHGGGLSLFSVEAPWETQKTQIQRKRQGVHMECPWLPGLGHPWLGHCPWASER